MKVMKFRPFSVSLSLLLIPPFATMAAAAVNSADEQAAEFLKNEAQTSIVSKTIDAGTQLIGASGTQLAQYMAQGSVEVDKLTITSQNTHNGDITADNYSHVSSGTVTATNSDFKNLAISTKNETDGIVATGGSTFAMGDVVLANVEAKGNIKIKSINKADEVRVKTGSSVRVGTTILN